jgi:hypothetical protein
MLESKNKLIENILLCLIFFSGFIFFNFTIQNDIFLIGLVSVFIFNIKNFKIKLDILSLFIIYLILNSIHGLINFNFDLSKIRWIFFFVMIFIISTKLVDFKFQFSTGFKYNILRILILKNIFYLFAGIFFENILKINRFELQPGHSSSFLFGTTAYFLFTNILFIPLFPIIERKSNLFKLFLLSLLIITSIYYDSRSSLGITIVVIMLFILNLKFKNFLYVIPLIFFTLSVIYSVVEWSDFQKVFVTVSNPAESTKDANDFDRFSHWAGATDFILNFSYFPYNLIGYGTRTSSFSIGPQVYKYLDEIGVGYEFFKETDVSNVGTNSYSGLLMDNGLFIVIIIIISFFSSTINGGVKNKVSYYLFVMTFIYYMFIIDLRDLPVFYLLFSKSLVNKLFY